MPDMIGFIKSPHRSLWTIVIGLLILLVGAGLFGFERMIAHPQAAPLPQQLAGIPLSIADTGAQAALEISRLHGQDFPLTSAAVGIYTGEQHARLWVSGFPMTIMASSFQTSMQEKIAATPDLPFTLTGETSYQGRKIILLEGLGQQHYVFRVGKTLIWLAVDPLVAEQALEQVINFYSTGD